MKTFAGITHRKIRPGIFLYLGIGIFFVSMVGTIWYFTKTYTPTETQTTTFQISQKKGATPAFATVSVTPVKVKVGDTQTITVTFKNGSDISSVVAITELDSRIKKIYLHALSKNQKTWAGKWEVNGTSHNTYITTIIAKNVQGKRNDVDISWIDPCSTPKVGAWTLDANCTISTTDGLENGIFTIPAGKTLTMTSGSVWVYESGYPIIVNGTIAIQAGGKLERSLLWVQDTDGDGYSSSVNTQISSLTQPLHYIRKKDTLGFNDCYDSNALAHPGQTSAFTVNRGDGSYDYNCDGIQTRSLTARGACTYSSKSNSYYTAIGWVGTVPACGVASSYYYTTAGCSTFFLTQSCK